MFLLLSPEIFEKVHRVQNFSIILMLGLKATLVISDILFQYDISKISNSVSQDSQDVFSL